MLAILKIAFEMEDKIKVVETTMEDKIKEWLNEADYHDQRRVLLIDLFKDYVCWCYDRGYSVKELTINGLSKSLVGLGYIKVQSYNGMYFLMSQGQVLGESNEDVMPRNGEEARKREEVGDGK